MKEKVLKIFATIVIAALAIICVTTLFDAGAEGTQWKAYVWTLFRLACSGFAIAYFYMDHSKRASVIYKIFGALFVLCQLEIFSLMIDGGYQMPCRVFAGIAVVLALVLLLVRNMGKKSFAPMIAINVIDVVYVVMTIMSKREVTDMFSVIIIAAQTLLLSLVYLAMLMGKYQDKDARGTK